MASTDSSRRTALVCHPTKRSYVADCILGRLYEFDVTRHPDSTVVGSAGPCRVHVAGFQWLDSLAIESGGKVCVATLWNGGITVFEPSGEYQHEPMPDVLTTNICFRGDDMRDAWITCSSTGRLLKVRWLRAGLKLPFNG